MRRHHFILSLIFGLLLMVPLRIAWADAPFLVVLPDPADGMRFVPLALSGDGSVIAGFDVLAPPAQGAGAAIYAVSWTRTNGLTKLFKPAPYQVLRDLMVSSNGTIFAGYFDNVDLVKMPKGVVGDVEVPFL